MFVGRVLSAVRWSGLISLEIFGSNINDWLQVWAAQEVPFDSDKLSKPEPTMDDVLLSAIRSLTMAGGRPDSNWTRLLLDPTLDCRNDQANPAYPQLRSLTVRGTDQAQQSLSHASAMFIHNLIYSSPLLELSLAMFNFRASMTGLLFVVRGAINVSSLDKLSLSNQL